MFDFVFENPRDGKFKDLEVIQWMLSNFSNSVKKVETSYCHYGFPFRKNTIFITSLTKFNAKPVCPSNPCDRVSSGMKHSSVVGSHEHDAQSTRKEFRNAIPYLLIDLIVDAWMQRHAVDVRAYMIIDVFAGWCSFHKRVRERQEAGSLPLNVYVYSNDIVKGRNTQCDFDMTFWSPSNLLLMALVQKFGIESESILSHPEGAEGWANDNRVAVLFHMSTPCETYSINAVCKHRVKCSAEPKSDEAAKADEMNRKLVMYVCKVVLGEDATPPISCYTRSDAAASSSSSGLICTPDRASESRGKARATNTSRKTVTFAERISDEPVALLTEVDTAAAALDARATEPGAGTAQIDCEAHPVVVFRKKKPPRKLPWNSERTIEEAAEACSKFRPTMLQVDANAQSKADSAILPQLPAPTPSGPSEALDGNKPSGCPKFSGMVFAISGVFPELGGGNGINLGKEEVANMIRSRNGRVAGSVSSKTTVLVVGKEPGVSKVREASIKDVPMVSLTGLRQMMNGAAVEEAESPSIAAFSSGYSGDVVVSDREAQFLRSEAKQQKIG